MSDFLSQVETQVLQYISIPYLCTFMALAYLIKTYFQVVLAKLLKLKVQFVYVVLLLAAIVAVPFLLTGTPFQKILFAYAIGTSLHEVFLTLIEKAVKKVTGATDPIIIIKPSPVTPVSTLPTVSPLSAAQPEAAPAPAPAPQPETPAQ